MSRAHFRHIRRVLYSLKRRYPQEVGLYRATGVATNFQTGVQSETRIKHTIPRAILLPSKLSRDFSYDLAYIAANKEFTQGAFYDHKARRVIISKRDIPADWPLDLNTWLVFQHTRHEIKEIVEFENNEGVMFILEALSGQPPKEIHDVFICDTLNLTDSAEGVV